MSTDENIVHQFIQDFAAYAEQQDAAEEALRLNNALHASHLSYLERALLYVQSGMPMDAGQMLDTFAKAEGARLFERTSIMVINGIEDAPQPYAQAQRELTQQIGEAIIAQLEARKAEQET